MKILTRNTPFRSSLSTCFATPMRWLKLDGGEHVVDLLLQLRFEGAHGGVAA